jgi:hypothetical protein
LVVLAIMLILTPTLQTAAARLPLEVGNPPYPECYYGKIENWVADSFTKSKYNLKEPYTAYVFDLSKCRDFERSDPIRQNFYYYDDQNIPTQRTYLGTSSKIVALYVVPGTSLLIK